MTVYVAFEDVEDGSDPATEPLIEYDGPVPAPGDTVCLESGYYVVVERLWDGLDSDDPLPHVYLRVRPCAGWSE